MASGNSSEGRFPFGKKAREKEIEFHRDVTAAMRLKEETEGRINKLYAVYDEPLEDSNYKSDSTFENTFRYALPPGSGTLRWYVEESLEGKKGRAVGVEFGGPGSALFAGFSKGFFARALGVTLADIRGNLEPNPTSRDEERHHSILEGDITFPQTYARVHEWLAGEKADFIVERMEGGRLNIPKDPILLGQAFNTWYEMLAENGIILAQTSSWMRPLLTKWKALLDAQCGDTLDVGYVADPQNADVFDAFRLQKLLGAPQTLPMLDMRKVREISKEMVKRGV